MKTYFRTYFLTYFETSPETLVLLLSYFSATLFFWGFLVLWLTRAVTSVLFLGEAFFRAEKTMTATDVTGFDAIFSTGFFATFSRF